VIALLQQRLDLAPEAVGPKALRTAIFDRMALLGLDAPEVYARRLASDPEEFLALAEEVVVPESWFFQRRGAIRVHRGPRPRTALRGGWAVSAAQRPLWRRAGAVLRGDCADGGRPPRDGLVD
jgi:hypothetical protein